jgi:uncharacterized OsmC-like protein
MNGDELRQLQAPLKARYKEQPETAMLTLCARGRVDQASITCTLETGKAGVPAGLHLATGGDGTRACSGDMLLEALVSCAGVTLASVSTAMGIPLKEATVSAEGDLDFRGTLGAAKEVPVGFQRIRLTFTFSPEMPREKLPKLIELTERYCVVLQTFSKPAAVEVRY